MKLKHFNAQDVLCKSSVGECDPGDLIIYKDNGLFKINLLKEFTNELVAGGRTAIKISNIFKFEDGSRVALNDFDSIWVIKGI